MAVRLYVGGIPVGITSQELEDRFLPFGSVVQCEIVPPKTHSILFHCADSVDRQTVSYPRNFGYVSLLPKDERSLQRAVSCYNGTRWRGSVMRCQIAKPTMMDTIAAEKAQMSEDEVTDEATRSQNVRMIEPGSTLRLRKPYTRHLVTVKFEGNKSNTIDLDGGRDEFEALTIVKEAAQEAAPRKRSYEEHLRSLKKEKEKTGAFVDNPGALGTNHPAMKKTHHQVEKSTFRSLGKPVGYLFKSPVKSGDGLVEVPSYPGSAANSKIVSFMSGEEVEASQGGTRHADIDLSRFNSDSEDEGGRGVSNIPQVDGGNDEESGDGGSMEASDIHASSPLPEEAIHKSSSESDSKDSVSTDDSATDSEAAPTDAVCDSTPGWLSESFPEGALFYRQEPLHQLEAIWRATKDGELQECKERRRQALRHSHGTRNGFLGKRKHTR